MAIGLVCLAILSDDGAMNEKSKKAKSGRNYTLVEVAKLMNEGGRPMSIAALRAACKNQELVSSKRRGVTVVSHDDFLDFLSAKSVVPEAQEAGPVTAESLALAKSALDGLRGRIEDEKSRRDVESESKAATVSITDTPSKSEDLENLSEGKKGAALIKETSPESSRPQETNFGEEVRAEEEGNSVLESPDLLKPTTQQSLSREPSSDSDSKGASEIEDVKDHLRPASGGGEVDVSLDLNPQPEALVADEPQPPPVEEGPVGQDMHMRCELEVLGNGEFRRHGTYQSWYLNEQQAALGHYVHGRLEGAWLQWHKNGRLQSEGHYLGGLQDGSWTTWDEQGGKLQVGNFVQGQADGAWYEFHGNGSIWRECHFEGGEVVGKQIYYGVEGAPLDEPDSI